MFSELDETIRQILVKEGGFDPGEIDVSFEIPNSEWSAGISKPTLNCYLFDIRENRDLQKTGVRVEKKGPDNGFVRRRPPMRLDLTYLVTAWTRAVEDEHRLLWGALSTLMRFDVLPGAHLQGVLRDHDLPIYATIARAEGVLKSPGEFWTALENQIKPSLSYVVTLAVDYEAVEAGPPISLLTTRIMRSTAEDEAAARGVAAGKGQAVATKVEIRGTVRNRAGAPVSGVTVTVEGRADDGRPTADDGVFALRNLLPGQRYTLRATRGDGAPQRITIDIPPVIVPSESGDKIDIPRVSYDIALELD